MYFGRLKFLNDFEFVQNYRSRSAAAECRQTGFTGSCAAEAYVCKTVPVAKMDGKLDGYKLDRYELLDLVELGHRRNDKLLSETEPITLQVIEHSFDLENGKVSKEPLHL